MCIIPANLTHPLSNDNMVTVAVAGGTGGIGRTLVEAILATGKHDVKILSRTVRNPNSFVHSSIC